MPPPRAKGGRAAADKRISLKNVILLLSANDDGESRIVYSWRDRPHAIYMYVGLLGDHWVDLPCPDILKKRWPQELKGHGRNEVGSCLRGWSPRNTYRDNWQGQWP